MADELEFEGQGKQIRRHIASSGRSRVSGRLARQLRELADEEIELDKEKDDKDKKRRKKKEKIRKPNVIGGGLALLSIIVLFLFLQGRPQEQSVKSAMTDSAKTDMETQKAMEKLQSEAQRQLDDVKKQAEGFNVKDATSPQINKLLDDAEGAGTIPGQIGEVLSEYSGGTIESVTETVSRFEKIVHDARAVKNAILETLQKL